MHSIGPSCIQALGFRLAPKSTTLDDFKRPLRKLCSMTVIRFGRQTKILIMINHTLLAQKCSQRTLVFATVPFMKTDLFVSVLNRY